MAVSLAFLQATGSTSDLTTYTFSSQNLGTAASDRYIIVAASCRKADPAATLSSATIGGVSATIIHQSTRSGNTVALFAAAVPTGTTGDIVVTWSTGVLRCGIGAYRVTGSDATTYHDRDVGTEVNNPIATIDVPAGGFAIATGYSAGNTTATWSGVTEDYDTTVESNNYTGASDTFGSAQTDLAITFTPSAAGGNPCSVAASWAEASGALSLTVDGFTNTNTFPAMTVSPGAVALSLAAFSDGDAFPAMAVTSGLTLGVGAFSDGDTFGALTVTPGAVTLTLAAFSDGDGFPAITVSSGETLSIGAFTNGNAFPAMTASPGAVTLSVAAFADGDAFGAITVTPGAVNLSVAAFSDADAFQAMTVTPGPAVLAVGAFADGDAFGLLSVAGPIIVTGFAAANAFPAMAVAGGDQPTPEVELPRGFVVRVPGVWRFGVRASGGRFRV